MAILSEMPELITRDSIYLEASRHVRVADAASETAAWTGYRGCQPSLSTKIQCVVALAWPWVQAIAAGSAL